MFLNLQWLYLIGFELVDDRMWVPMMEQAVKVIYKLAERPDSICEDIIRKIIGALMKHETQQSSEILLS